MDKEVKETIIQSYNANAKLRDKIQIEEWKQYELNRFIESFDSVNGLKLLDVGAGSGQHSQYLQNRGFDVQCIDLSPEMVKSCLEKGLQAEVMDVYDITYEDNFYDAVWSMNALLHVPKNSMDIVLHHLMRILKPEGLFYLGLYGGNDSEGYWEEDPYKPNRYFSFYSHDSIQEKIQEFFEIKQFEVVPLDSTNMDFQSMIFAKKM